MVVVAAAAVCCAFAAVPAAILFIAVVLFQSVNILVYVCSHQGDIRQKQKAKTYNY